MVISSETAVTAKAKLVDLRNGKTLWEGTAHASSAEQQSNSGGGLVGMLIVTAKILGDLRFWDTHPTPALTTHSPHTFLKPRDPRREPP